MINWEGVEGRKCKLFYGTIPIMACRDSRQSQKKLSEQLEFKDTNNFKRVFNMILQTVFNTTSTFKTEAPQWAGLNFV